MIVGDAATNGARELTTVTEYANVRQNLCPNTRLARPGAQLHVAKKVAGA
jgi:hypothetical protein